MANLLKETMATLRESGKEPSDISWCGSPGWGWFSWEDFARVADEEYDEIASDLLIVGKDFWLERHEYDGSEWWEHKKLPARPTNYNKPLSLMRINENK